MNGYQVETAAPGCIGSPKPGRKVGVDTVFPTGSMHGTTPNLVLSLFNHVKRPLLGGIGGRFPTLKAESPLRSCFGRLTHFRTVGFEEQVYLAEVSMLGFDSF